MSKHSEAVKKYDHKLKSILLNSFGNECLFCSSKENLEFAHKKPDDMNGMGRGRNHRYRAIRKTPENYFLLCHDCHRQYDDFGIVTIIDSNDI